MRIPVVVRTLGPRHWRERGGFPSTSTGETWLGEGELPVESVGVLLLTSASALIAPPPPLDSTAVVVMVCELPVASVWEPWTEYVVLDSEIVPFDEVPSPQSIVAKGFEFQCGLPHPPRFERVGHRDQFSN